MRWLGFSDQSLMKLLQHPMIQSAIMDRAFQWPKSYEATSTSTTNSDQTWCMVSVTKVLRSYFNQKIVILVDKKEQFQWPKSYEATSTPEPEEGVKLIVCFSDQSLTKLLQQYS